MSKISNGCPFNHFGPCMEEKCGFYLNISERENECAVISSAINSHMAAANVEIMLQIVNLAGYSLQIASCLPPTGIEYEVLKGFADAYFQLAQSPFVSDSARKQLLQGGDEIRRILAALYPDDE